MYINFEQLVSSGLSPNDLINLLAIRQKEKPVIESISNEDLEVYQSFGFVENKGKGMIRLTNKGTSFLTTVETPIVTDDILDTLNGMISIYEGNGKEIGVSRLEAQSRLAWFMCNTNFKKDLIIGITKQYVQESNEYTLSLCNFIWRPQSSAFSIHKNLKDSKLFDLISFKYGLNTEYYFKDSQNALMKWLFAVSRLPNPPAKSDDDCWFTGNSKQDKERLIGIKTCLLNILRKWKK